MDHENHWWHRYLFALLASPFQLTENKPPRDSSLSSAHLEGDLT